VTHDRLAHWRDDPEQLARAWVAAGSRALVVADGTVLAAVDGDRARPIWFDCPDAPAGERYLLGGDHDQVSFAVRPIGATEPLLGPQQRFVGLRELAAVLTGPDAALTLQAVALANWHQAHPHCSRCGAGTEVTLAGYQRRCPDDGAEHYPRTDPAVIMAVVDGDDRILLGHQARWPDGWFSTLAGFVEPGETAEEAVAREVAEEVGVQINSVAYRVSQPWPFPSSLMLGFRAGVVGTGPPPTPDGVEIVEARWFTREELRAATAEGLVRLSPRESVARRLIEEWFGDGLTGGE
jgi:NAD+ diphosphatase